MRPEIKNYNAEADADLIPISGQLELHGRCRCGVLLSACFCALFVADLTVGMEELELHYRRRGRSNFRKIKIATISVRMVGEGTGPEGERWGMPWRRNPGEQLRTDFSTSFLELGVVSPHLPGEILRVVLVNFSQS